MSVRTIQKNDDIIIRLCEVLSVEDDNAGLRIKVRIDPDDGDVQYVDDLPYAFPLLPKLIHVNPKVGECVMVILSTQGQSNGNRWFIGPLISQQYMTNYDPFKFSSRCLLEGQQVARPLPNPSQNPLNNGTIPEHDDIALQGRQNTDVILKDNELRIRCGFKKYPLGKPKDTLTFNDVDLGYIQMKYKQMKDNNGNNFSSVTNIISDRINLLTYDSANYFNMTDPTSLITDDELLKILENAHPLPYGDRLMDFLSKLIKIFREHTHPFPMDPPCFTQPEKQILATDLTKMLSQGVRIN